MCIDASGCTCLVSCYHVIRLERPQSTFQIIPSNLFNNVLPCILRSRLLEGLDLIKEKSKFDWPRRERDISTITIDAHAEHRSLEQTSQYLLAGNHLRWELLVQKIRINWHTTSWCRRQTDHSASLPFKNIRWPSTRTPSQRKLDWPGKGCTEHHARLSRRRTKRLWRQRKTCC